jgi:hypothetical protein
MNQEAVKNYFLKKIVRIFLGNRTSDDSRPTLCARLGRHKQSLAVRVHRSAMILVRFVVARSWDGLFVYDLDLLVEDLPGEAINRPTFGRRGGDRRSDAPSSAPRQGL